MDAPTLAEIEAARARLAGVSRVTPVVSSETLSRLTGRPVVLKAENLQRTGAFKIRGAYNTIAQLDADERRSGVVTASAGNHGQAVAWAAREAGIDATIFVPVAAPFGGYWTPYAKAFYTAQSLGVLDKTHEAMFSAIHVERSLPVQPLPTNEQIGEFYAKYGVDAKTFASTMSSFGVETKLNRAKQFAVRSKIEGTPSIVVDGKYLVSVDQRGYDVMFNTIDHLVARERAALAGPAK